MNEDMKTRDYADRGQFYYTNTQGKNIFNGVILKNTKLLSVYKSRVFFQGDVWVYFINGVFYKYKNLVWEANRADKNLTWLYLPRWHVPAIGMDISDKVVIPNEEASSSMPKDVSCLNNVPDLEGPSVLSDAQIFGNMIVFKQTIQGKDGKERGITYSIKIDVNALPDEEIIPITRMDISSYSGFTEPELEDAERVVEIPQFIYSDKLLGGSIIEPKGQNIAPSHFAEGFKLEYAPDHAPDSPISMWFLKDKEEKGIFFVRPNIPGISDNLKRYNIILNTYVEDEKKDGYSFFSVFDRNNDGAGNPVLRGIYCQKHEEVALKIECEAYGIEPMSIQSVSATPEGIFFATDAGLSYTVDIKGVLTFCAVGQTWITNHKDNWVSVLCQETKAMKEANKLSQRAMQNDKPTKLTKAPHVATTLAIAGLKHESKDKNIWGWYDTVNETFTFFVSTDDHVHDMNMVWIGADAEAAGAWLWDSFETADPSIMEKEGFLYYQKSLNREQAKKALGKGILNSDKDIPPSQMVMLEEPPLGRQLTGSVVSANGSVDIAIKDGFLFNISRYREKIIIAPVGFTKTWSQKFQTNAALEYSLTKKMDIAAYSFGEILEGQDAKGDTLWFHTGAKKLLTFSSPYEDKKCAYFGYGRATKQAWFMTSGALIGQNIETGKLKTYPFDKEKEGCPYLRLENTVILDASSMSEPPYVNLDNCLLTLITAGEQPAGPLTIQQKFLDYPVVYIRHAGKKNLILKAYDQNPKEVFVLRSGNDLRLLTEKQIFVLAGVFAPENRYTKDDISVSKIKIEMESLKTDACFLIKKYLTRKGASPSYTISLYDLVHNSVKADKKSLNYATPGKFATKVGTSLFEDAISSAR